eukprot:TRINITY_DN11448_c0_g1_i1.p1 TRINITY_DN11448_c0_g1~~TRINITY_DN11448_c0_g1_i1.p1  ORF type:complete len:359 (-),score=107.58 TRINITY_DN11448_c0_g1_i1:73-1149(-)
MWQNVSQFDDEIDEDDMEWERIPPGDPLVDSELRNRRQAEEDAALAQALAMEQDEEVEEAPQTSFNPLRRILPTSFFSSNTRGIGAARDRMQSNYNEAAALEAAKRASREAQKRAAAVSIPIRSQDDDEDTALIRALEASKHEEDLRLMAIQEEEMRRMREEEEEERTMQEILRKSAEEAERQEREAERADLEARYQESLRLDREKEQRAREAERIAREAEERERLEAERRELEEAMKLSEELSSEQRKKEALLEKLARLPVEPPSGSQDATTALQIRLPTGIRMERKFFTDKDSLRTVRDYIDSLPVVDENKFKNVVPDSYKLVADFPRREFDESVSATLLRQAGLTGRTVLTVEPL